MIKATLYLKLILTVIAFGLMVIALNPWVSPRVASGSPDLEADIGAIRRDLYEIRNYIRDISRGFCTNRKIC